jgi:hypothetical protein
LRKSRGRRSLGLHAICLKCPNTFNVERDAVISQSGKDKSGAFVQIETIFKDDNKTILVVV